MSNIFKKNSRFSALVEDISEQKNNKEQKRTTEANVENKEERFNSFKLERPLRTESNFRGFNEKGRERYRLEREAEMKAYKELVEREKERIKQESLKIENFPNLVASSKKENNEDKTKISYMEKLKKEEKEEKEIKNNIDKDLENLKPGWVLLKSDNLTKRTIIKQYHETNIVEEKENSEKEIALNILNALVKLHERRTEEYIENYGYEEWEKMFKFSDWREREAYLEEMEEMENESYESEYEDEDL